MVVRWLVFVLFAISTIGLNVSANLTDNSELTTMYLMCESSSDCYLSDEFSGQETLTGTINQASPFNPVTLLFEFEMSPKQTDLAILSDSIRFLQVDFHMEAADQGEWQPEVVIEVNAGDNSVSYQEEADYNILTNEVYRINDLAFETGNDILYPEDQVKVFIMFEVDTPGDWEFGLQAGSYIQFEVEWSADIESANQDEPSSESSPISTDVDTEHHGALVFDDVDCWSVTLTDHEILKVFTKWDEVPDQIEQLPRRWELKKSNGNLAPYPEDEITIVDGGTRITSTWRDIPSGETELCLRGVENRFQSYNWIGTQILEGEIGSTGNLFSQDTNYRSIISNGDIEGSKEVQNGYFDELSMILTLGVFVFVFFGFKEKELRKNEKRVLTIGLSLLIISGLLHPIVKVVQENHDESSSFDGWLERRVEGIWEHHMTNEGISDSLEGESLGFPKGMEMDLILNIERYHVLSDGTYAYVPAQLENFDIEAYIFSFLESKDIALDYGLVETEVISFIIEASRILILDFRLIEVMLISESKPSSQMIQIRDEMVDSIGIAGPSDAQVWLTQPKQIEVSKWQELVRVLYPDNLQISFCDCEKKEIEFSYQNSGDLVVSKYALGLTKSPDGIIPLNGAVWCIALIMCGYAHALHRRK
ncbi:MAG: hypothetical protein CMA84_03000 [Euryarchaeota archaeon]|nr:hypothetical protein [Euryarchaeota archaeon]